MDWNNRLIKFLTKTQENMWNTIYNYNNKKYTKYSKLGKYVYYKSHHTGLRPLILCHIDTCNEGGVDVNDILISDNNRIQLKDKSSSKYTCLGGDDRVGVAIALTLLEYDNKADFVFLCDEEIGGIGAKEFSYSEYVEDNEWSFLLEIDRKGTNHIASYGYDNDELEKILGLPVERGSYTDLCDVSEVCGIAGYNIACGYYNQHTTSETVNIKQAINCFNQVESYINHKLLNLSTYLCISKKKYTKYSSKSVSEYSYLDTYTSYDDEDYQYCTWCGELHPKKDILKYGICKECLKEDEKYIDDYYKDLGNE